MNAFNAIFSREFMGYFRTPVAYVFLGAFVVASVSLPWYAAGFFQAGEASLERFFLFIPWLFTVLIPAVGMRLWSEEHRLGTLELLMTMPVTAAQAVLAKFFAGWLFIGLAIVLTVGMPLTVGYLGDPDWGVIAGGYLGCLLMAGAYLAVCSWVSSLTKSQVIAFVISLLFCLVLVLLGWSAFNELMYSLNMPVWLVDAIANFSFQTHFEPMCKGIIAVPNVLYFATVMVASLWLNIISTNR